MLDPLATEKQQNFAVDGGSFSGTQSQYNDYLTTHPQPVTTPTTPTTTQVPEVVDASNLGGNKMSTPDQPQPQSTDAFVKSLFDQYNAPVDAAVKTNNDLTTQLTTASTALEGKGAAQLAKETELGVTQDTAKLKDLNTLIASKSAEYQNKIAALPGQGRGLTTGLVAAQTDREKRMAAVELGGLASVPQALQGNIALSQDTAKRAVDMEFAPYEQQIKNTLTLLQLNEGNLTRAEAKRADEIKIALSERQRQLDQAKSDKTDIMGYASQAGLAGADNATVAKILKQTDTIAAFNMASPFVNAQAAKDLAYKNSAQSLDLQSKQAQIKLTNAQTNKAWADARAANNPVEPSAVVDSNSNSVLAQTGLSSQVFNYLTQGTSSMTRLSATQRNQIVKEADAFLNKNGLDFSTFQSRYKAYNETLSKNVSRFNNTTIAEGEIKGTIENLSTAANEKEFGKLKVKNVAKLFAGEQLNDPATLKYAVHLNQLVNELAQYNAAVQGKASPDLAELEEAKRVIKNGISAGSLTGFSSALTASVEKMGQTLQGSVDRSNKQVWSLFGVGDNYKTQLEQDLEKHKGIVLPGVPGATANGSTFNGITLPH